MAPADALPQRNPPPQPRLSDEDLLEIIEPVYEWAVWAADISLVDFEPFADLSLAIAELRQRVAA